MNSGSGVVCVGVWGWWWRGGVPHSGDAGDIYIYVGRYEVCIVVYVLLVAINELGNEYRNVACGFGVEYEIRGIWRGGMVLCCASSLGGWVSLCISL